MWADRVDGGCCAMVQREGEAIGISVGEAGWSAAGFGVVTERAAGRGTARCIQNKRSMPIYHKDTADILGLYMAEILQTHRFLLARHVRNTLGCVQ